MDVKALRYRRKDAFYVMKNVKDNDKGWKRITRKMLALDKKEVSAGVHDDAGNEDNGKPIALVAFWNEYGTKRKNKDGAKVPHIPPRPFIRISFDDHNGEWVSEADKQLTAMVNAGKTANGALNAVGRRMKKDIKKIIGDKSKLKPNAPSTIAKKGFDKPLYETGKLKAAIDFKVE